MDKNDEMNEKSDGSLDTERPSVVRNPQGKSPAGESIFALMEDEQFRFECRPDVTCFTRCCRDLKLMLTPYDIFRLTDRLSISSQELIDRYTDQEPDQVHGYPRLTLMMRPDDGTCPFLSPEGCTVYEDRPGACRLYPIGRASRVRKAAGGKIEEWFFTVREPHCQGFKEPRVWTVRGWFSNQGVNDYTKVNDRWMEIILQKPKSTSVDDLAKKMKMFFLASYQLDEFSDFVFSPGFQRRFDITLEQRQAMADDPRELLDFAVQWLQFCLFGEKTMTIKP